MAITPRTSTTTSGNRTTGFPLVIDASVQEGDILLLGVTNRDATADPSVTDDDTGGNSWAKVHNQNSTTNGAGTVWWKRATSGTASKTITVSGCTGSASGVVTPYSGALASGTPYGTPAGETNASGNETQVGITVGTANSFVCAYVFNTSNDTLAPTSFTCATDPATLADRGTGISTGGSDCSVSHASAVKTSTGATGDVSWAQTNGVTASIVFELIVAAVESNASVSFTQASDTATITATVPASAAVSFTQANDTAAITATVPVLASVSHTQAADTVSASAEVTEAGNNASVSFTQASDTATITATSAVSASVAITQAADSATITATVATSAAVSFTQAADTATIAATLAGSASVALTQADDAVSATATVPALASVSFAQAGDVVTGSMTGEEAPAESFASVSFTQASDVSSITATAAIAAAVAATQASDTVTSSATAAVAAVLSFSQAADSVSFTATSAVVAAIEFTQADDTVAATIDAEEDAAEYPAVLVPTGNVGRRRRFGARFGW